MDSKNSGSKLVEEKISCQYQTHRDIFLVIMPYAVYLHNIYIELGMISNLENLKYMGGCAQALCKYNAILY